MTWLRQHALGVAAAALALVVVFPLLAQGFALRYDMVFVPRPPFSRDMLGLGRQLPRSVPSALLVALLSRALTGQVVEKLVLLAIFAGAAFGAGRLVPSDRWIPKMAGGVLYAWNPLTYERLLLGHWAFLLGYAALPWVAASAMAFRRGRARAGWHLVLSLAAAVASSPYTGIFAGALASAVVLTPPWGSRRAGEPWREAGVVVGSALALNLPWLLPALLHKRVADQPALAVALFRARSDSPLGTLGSLLSLGGLWRTDIAPAGRNTVAWIPAFILIAGIAILGWRMLGKRWPVGARNGLLLLAGLGLAVAFAPTFPGLRPALAWAERTFPGGGFFRDSQKFVIPLALAEAVGFGLGVERVLDAMPSTRAARLTAGIVFSALPIALAPTLAWGATGTLFTASYPSSWARVQRITAADPQRGAILVLPWHAYLPFRWNHELTVRQPAPLFFSREVLSSTALEVVRSKLPEEDDWSALAAGPATDPAPLGPRLSSLGVRYVLVFKEVEWRTLLPKLNGLRPILDTGDLSLYASEGPARSPAIRKIPLAPVAAGDGIALLVVGVAFVGAARGSGMGRRRGTGIAGDRLDILQAHEGPEDRGC